MTECAPTSKSRTRVMIVDDSAVVRGLIAKDIEADPDLELVCTASNGEIALRELGRKIVDVIVLDIEMPVMDGFEALRRIVSEHPSVKVIMASTLTRRNAELGLRALQEGAVDCMAKPENGLAGAREFQQDLRRRVKALGATPTRSTPTPRPATPVVRLAPGQPDVLTIGASTGGPPALQRLFQDLRGVVRQPILLTQHMPPTFTALLAEQLSRAGDRPCAEAQDGESVVPGRCYVAPGGWHMTVERKGVTPAIRLNQDPPENFCRPAVDPMLRSAAQVYGRGVMAVILTGMGADGAKGCEMISRVGGRFIVQDEATSVVWGMPGAAAATGRAERVLPIGEIGPWLRRTMEAER